MMMPWPSKKDRQQIELDMFINGYRALEWGGEIELVKWRERPDCEIRDVKTGQIFGLELTSAYLTDKRVESYRRGLVKVPHQDSSLIEAYKLRLIEAVREKVEKAQHGYEIYPRMVLGIYVGDIIAIHLDHKDDWHRFYEQYRSDFEEISPFSEVVFYNLANGDTFATNHVE